MTRAFITLFLIISLYQMEAQQKVELLFGLGNHFFKSVPIQPVYENGPSVSTGRLTITSMNAWDELYYLSPKSSTSNSFKLSPLTVDALMPLLAPYVNFKIGLNDIFRISDYSFGIRSGFYYEKTKTYLYFSFNEYQNSFFYPGYYFSAPVVHHEGVQSVYHSVPLLLKITRDRTTVGTDVVATKAKGHLLVGYKYNKAKTFTLHSSSYSWLITSNVVGMNDTITINAKDYVRSHSHQIFLGYEREFASVRGIRSGNRIEFLADFSVYYGFGNSILGGEEYEIIIGKEVFEYGVGSKGTGFNVTLCARFFEKDFKKKKPELFM